MADPTSISVSVAPASSLDSASLTFEKKNKPQPRLPLNTKIQRRPLNHPPVASPYAGSAVQKVVYVSRKTPLMAAVKRVKKLLAQIERRAFQGIDRAATTGRDGMKRVADASDQLARDGEEVLVKGSGRAIEQVLKVGEWFRSKEDELGCKVEVRTGSALVVDDIVEVVGQEESPEHGGLGAGSEEQENKGATAVEDVECRGAERQQGENSPDVEMRVEGHENVQKARHKKNRNKRKRAMYDKDDVPEARTRWIKTVEVAISLKG